MRSDKSYEPEILKSLPKSTQDAIRVVWDSMNQSDRDRVTSLLSNIPTKPNLLKILVDLSVVQMKTTFGNKQKVAIVGPANTGKSTLFNQLITDKKDQTEISPLPGTTRINLMADAGIFSVADTPGADAVGDLGQKEKTMALDAAKEADFLMIIFDASQGIRKSEKSIFRELSALKKPYIVLLNKIDLVRGHVKSAVEKAAENLAVQPEQITPISAKNGENLDRIFMSIAITEPEIIAAMGQALPQFRWNMAWRTIVRAATISGVIAITPIPVIDFAPLIINQSVMVLGIARIYRYQITMKRARELVVTFGIGYIGRTLFYELSKLGGIPGWLLSIAIAVSTTVAMGYAAAIWFEKGEKLSSDTLDRITREITATILQVLRRSQNDRSDKIRMKERIGEALEQIKVVGEIPIEDRQGYDQS